MKVKELLDGQYDILGMVFTDDEIEELLEQEVETSWGNYIVLDDGSILFVTEEKIQYWEHISEVPYAKELLQVWGDVSQKVQKEWRDCVGAPENYIPVWDVDEEETMWAPSPKELEDCTPDPAYYFCWNLEDVKIYNPKSYQFRIGTTEKLILNNTNVKPNDWYEIVSL